MTNKPSSLNMIITCIGCMEMIEVKELLSIPNIPDNFPVNGILEPEKCFIAVTNCRTCERRIKNSLEKMFRGSPGVPCVSSAICDAIPMRKSAFALGYSEPCVCDPPFVTMDQIMIALGKNSTIGSIRMLESDIEPFDVERDSLRSSFIVDLGYLRPQQR